MCLVLPARCKANLKIRKGFCEGSYVFWEEFVSVPRVFEEYSMFPCFIVDQLSKGIYNPTSMLLYLLASTKSVLLGIFSSSPLFTDHSAFLLFCKPLSSCTVCKSHTFCINTYDEGYGWCSCVSVVCDISEYIRSLIRRASSFSKSFSSRVPSREYFKTGYLSARVFPTYLFLQNLLRCRFNFFAPPPPLFFFQLVSPLAVQPSSHKVLAAMTS